MYKMTSFCIKLFKKKKKNNETTLFYNSLNLTLYSLLPSHFMPLCYHASLLNHIAQQHRYYLSLSKNFLKLKLDYKSYIYMLNIIHTHTHTHTHTYIYMAVGSVTHRNAKSTTVCRTGYYRYLEIASNHHAIHLRWSSVGCGSDRCRLVLSTASGI